jgi:3-hydroxyacyl-CoA dehydrogenase
MANTEKILLNNVSKGRLNEEKMKVLLARITPTEQLR